MFPLILTWLKLLNKSVFVLLKCVYMTLIISIEWYVDSAEISDLHAIIISDIYEGFNVKKWMLQDCGLFHIIVFSLSKVKRYKSTIKTNFVLLILMKALHKLFNKYTQY